MSDRFRFVSLLAAIGLVLSLCVPARAADQPSKDTDWLKDAKYGVFMHFLPDGDEDLALVEKFDVNALADQLEAVGAKYFCITLGQNSGYYNSPNSVYDKYVGLAPGERCSKRDLPMELYPALKAKGIRMMLYLPCQGPNRYPRAQKALALPEGEKDFLLDDESAKRWAEVIQEWSDRYGDKVSGWWFDGGYGHVLNEKYARVYADAAKHGNPHSIVTFNRGLGVARAKQAEDYTAGEARDAFVEVPVSRSVNGSQWHVLTYLGDTWNTRNTRFPSEQWTAWVKKVTDLGGAVTLDVGPNFTATDGPIGTISDEQMAQLKAIKAAVYGNEKTDSKEQK